MKCEFEEDGGGKQGDKDSDQLADLVVAAGVAQFTEFKADGGEDEGEGGFSPHDIPACGEQAAQRGNEPCGQDEGCECNCSRQTDALYRGQLIQQRLVGFGVG